MVRIPRIGLFYGPSIDPFWVQVLEAIYQKAHELGADLIAIDSDLPPWPSGEETALYEELLAQDLDVVIGWGFPEDLARQVLVSGVPIVHLNETDTRHPLCVSPKGLYEIARLIGALLVEKLHGRGNVLAVGGLLMLGRDDDGKSRVAGFHDALGHYLYRASDVPLNFALNRWQVTMLRLLAPDRAVHLDPALWHPDDSDENVAVHLINAICTVPTVSVELDRYPQRHLDLIRYWIGFYQAHRATIIHGQFAPDIRLGHVPLIRFTDAAERIIGVYDDVAFAAGAGVLPLWILNASTRPFVELCPDGLVGPKIVCTRDKFGCVVGEHAVTFPVARLPVEVGGSLEIRRRASS